MKILKLKLSSFKNFDTKEFIFGDNNIITGKNGVGKSTIKDAIIFLLFNCTPDGSTADSTKFIKRNHPKCVVEAEFDDGMILRRERTEKGTRITHLDNSQSLEDSNITQRELESMIPSQKIFLSVFNIGHFMTLDYKEKRDLVLSFTKSVDKKQIYLDSGGSIDFLEKFNLSLDDCKSSHKSLLERRKTTNESFIKSNGEIEALSTKIEIPEQKYKDVSEEISLIEKDIFAYSKFEKDLAVYNLKEKSFNETEKKNARLKARMKELQESATRKVAPSKNVIDQLKSDIHLLESKIKQYESLPEEANCSTCGQNIPESHRHLVAEEIKKARTEIESIQKKLGKEEEDFSNKMIEFEKFKRAETEFQVCKNQLKKVLKPEPIVEIEKPDTEKYKSLKTKQGEFVAEKRYIEKLTADEAERQNKISEITSYQNNLQEILREVEKHIPIFSPGGVPSIEMRVKVVGINSILNKYLPKSEIITLEVLKNGLDTKEVFTLMVDGKEYKKLSTGERLKADIAIGATLEELSDNQVGMRFVDNAESIDHEPELIIQSFLAKVTDDKNLQVITK